MSAPTGHYGVSFLLRGSRRQLSCRSMFANIWMTLHMAPNPGIQSALRVSSPTSGPPASVSAIRSVGLRVIPRRASSTLEAFLEAYIDGRTDLKPRTLAKLRTTQEYLVDRFGAEKPLRDIYARRRGQLSSVPPRRVTARTRPASTCHHQAVFHAAARRRLIPSNPFADLKSVTQANPERFTSCPWRSRPGAGCLPDTEWRLIFALSRFGGLRCPSEHLGLRWITSTGNGPNDDPQPQDGTPRGGASRVIPIFPELRPYLEPAFEEAPEGADYVITRIGTRTRIYAPIWNASSGGRLGALAQAVPESAGSTRQTELEETFPTHVVCEWIGAPPRSPPSTTCKPPKSTSQRRQKIRRRCAAA